jgi:filamentous hemagglutinin family protein
MFTDRRSDISRGTIWVQLRRAIVRIVRAPSAVLGPFRPIGHLPFFGSILAFALAPSLGWAQHITIDGRFSPAQTLAAVGGTYSIGANLGKQVGSNLFHSFGQFGLSTGETAAFSGPATTSNVIGRVTGGNPSAIDGKIQSNIAGANLYLINPSGIVFGPNATVNVSGSFHASTADYLKMSDGTKFQATNPNGSTLSAAPPAAFGFLNASPAAITVNGSTLGPVPGTLGLVAGPVSITGATLSAPAGTIHVTSVASPGEAPVDPRDTPASTATSFGPVDIKGGSKLDVSNPSGLGSGGSVFIRSGALTVDASEINGDNYGPGRGGVLSLRGDNQITLNNSANVHAVAMDSGNGASITIVAGQLTLRNGANVLAQSTGSGSGGDVIVSVGGSLTVDSGASLGTTTGITPAGMPVANTGAAGNVNVTVAGPITIDMSVGAVASLLDGIGSGAVGKGNAGNVTLVAGALTIKNNGLVSSTTIGAGNSGSVSVNVSGTLSVDGSNGITPLETGISADAGCFQCGSESGNAEGLPSLPEHCRSSMAVRSPAALLPTAMAATLRSALPAR